MKIINCPLNGPCNAQEFVCGGEVKLPPTQNKPPEGADIEPWADYIFMQENPRGLTTEWWCHVASGYWFIAERDTITDTMLRTFTCQEWFARPAQKDSNR